MDESEIRRSHRIKTVDLDGRGYLSTKLGITVEELDSWLQSAEVQPHLHLWYKMCVKGARRYNFVLALVNNGDFENPNNAFEEELLLFCLTEGQEDSERFSSELVQTKTWTTPEVWARTAWRVVHSNRSDDQLFARVIKSHPARCYALVIDLLCLAFHSIAYREKQSCYVKLILRAPMRSKVRRAPSKAVAQTPSAMDPSIDRKTPSTPSPTDTSTGHSHVPVTPLTTKVHSHGKDCECMPELPNADAVSTDLELPFTPPAT